MGIEVDLLPSSHAVPKESDDAWLSHVCKSVKRLLTKAHGQISRLHHIDAKTLNSFQAGTMSQDPFAHLQEATSLKMYSRTIQRLLCYFFRVRDSHFKDLKRNMFKVTNI